MKTPAPDFDHPIELLQACHGRIEDRIETLERLLAHLAQNGCDEQARQAAANVIRYFDSAGEHHHEDEEANLFPALAAEASKNGDVAALIEQLRRDHVRMRALWQALRVPLATIAAGASADLDRGVVDEFARVYRTHMKVEDDALFPVAVRVLGEDALAALGGAMAQRRGVRI